MNLEFIAAVVLGVLVTVSLAWLARYLSGVARRSAPGRGAYPRAVARAAVGALVLWCVGLALPLAVLVHWLPKPVPPPAQTPGGAPATPGEVSPDFTTGRDTTRGGITPAEPSAPSPEPGASAAGREGEEAPASGEEFEYTLQPALPPALAEAMAEAQSNPVWPTGEPGPVILATGRVRILSAGPDGHEVTLVNQSGYAVSLDGWSFLVRWGEDGPRRWCHFTGGPVLPPSAELRVLAGQAARAAGLRPGVAEAGVYVWTTSDLWEELGPSQDSLPGPSSSSGETSEVRVEVVLYDRDGVIQSD